MHGVSCVPSYHLPLIDDITTVYISPAGSEVSMFLWRRTIWM